MAPTGALQVICYPLRITTTVSYSTNMFILFANRFLPGVTFWQCSGSSCPDSITAPYFIYRPQRCFQEAFYTLLTQTSEDDDEEVELPCLDSPVPSSWNQLEGPFHNVYAIKQVISSWQLASLYENISLFSHGLTTAHSSAHKPKRQKEGVHDTQFKR